MKKFDKLALRSIFLIIFSIIAIIIGLVSNSLKHKFLIDANVLFIIICVFSVIGLIIFILSNILEFKKIIYNLLDYLVFIGTCLSIIFIVASTIIAPVRVSGESMYPTYNDGKILLISKINKLEKGDIAVFYVDDERIDELNNHLSRLKGELLIKRVVGLPGDKIKKNGNYLYVNGEIQDGLIYSDIIIHDLTSDGYIPEGKVLLLGDNRSNSTDSRAFGLVDIKNIVGYAI